LDTKTILCQARYKLAPNRFDYRGSIAVQNGQKPAADYLKAKAIADNSLVFQIKISKSGSTITNVNYQKSNDKNLQAYLSEISEQRKGLTLLALKSLDDGFTQFYKEMPLTLKSTPSKTRKGYWEFVNLKLNRKLFIKGQLDTIFYQDVKSNIVVKYTFKKGRDGKWLLASRSWINNGFEQDLWKYKFKTLNQHPIIDKIDMSLGTTPYATIQFSSCKSDG
tara:strand:- start:15 stop:677 length:663 start_codon:yes stop_codon:yes gene_type:complete